MSEIIGQRFEKLVVKEQLNERDSDNRILFLCLCDCGTEVKVSAKRLKSKNTASCGCSRRDDLTGQVINGIKVLKSLKHDNPDAKSKASRVLCLCPHCGKEFIIETRALKAGQKSCGCLVSTTAFNLKPGDKVGFWTLIKATRIGNKNGASDRAWDAECICGTVKTVVERTLAKGLSTNCGCKRRERLSQRNFKHGMSSHYLHPIWCRIVAVCTNPQHPDFAYYGGRGITCLDLWLNDVVKFISDVLSEIGERPTPKHELDRIHNHGNYEPGNLRWATKLEQQNNTRWNYRIKDSDGQVLSARGYALKHCVSWEDARKIAKEQGDNRG